MGFVRTLLRYITYIITAVVLGLYLLASYSPECNPVHSVLPAFLGLAFPFILGLQLLVTLYWLLRLRWRMLCLLTLVYALSWSSLSAYFPINRSSEQQRYEAKAEGRQGKQVLKVLSYNVCIFGFTQHSAQKPNKTLLYIKSSKADIVCLQEANFSHYRDYGPTLGQIKAYLSEEYPYVKYEYSSDYGGSCLMVLSRYPIKSSERIPLHSFSNGAAAFTLDVQGRETTLINLHLESFRLSNAIGKAYMKMVAEGDVFTLEDALKSKLGPTFVSQSRQVDVIKEYIHSRGLGQRLIIAGDFNATPVSYTLRALSKGMTNAYTEAGNGQGFSFRSKLFKVRIDHILLGGTFRAISTEVDRSARGSDHYPIYSYIIDKEAL